LKLARGPLPVVVQLQANKLQLALEGQQQDGRRSTLLRMKISIIHVLHCFSFFHLVTHIHVCATLHAAAAAKAGFSSRILSFHGKQANALKLKQKAAYRLNSNKGLPHLFFFLLLVPRCGGHNECDFLTDDAVAIIITLMTF